MFRFTKHGDYSQSYGCDFVRAQNQSQFHKKANFRFAKVTVIIF